MRHTRVAYRKLVSGPGFEHQAIEVEATVDPTEAATDVLEFCRAFVMRELGKQPEPVPLTSRDKFEATQRMLNMLDVLANEYGLAYTEILLAVIDKLTEVFPTCHACEKKEGSK